MTYLGTDIEHDIREAIVGALGPMRSEMWFGKEARIEIQEACVKVHAVNSFAADWVGKNYLMAILGQCRPILEKDQRIEIVSQEYGSISRTIQTEIDHRTAALMPEQSVAALHENPKFRPRFDGGFLPQKHRADQKVPRFADVLPKLPVGRLSCSFLEDRTTVTSNASCEKEVALPIPSAGKRKKNSVPASSGVCLKPVPADTGIIASGETERMPRQRRKAAKLPIVSLPPTTPQERNEQIITNGRNKLAGMIPPTESHTPSHRSRRGKSRDESPDEASGNKLGDRNAVTTISNKAAIPGQRFFAGCDGVIEQGDAKKNRTRKTATPSTSTAKSESRTNRSATVIPALKRDEANRNVVAVPGRTTGRTKSIGGNPAMSWASFVVGPSNKLAVRAAELAIHHSGQISPIYIYGPTSVGKTHLLEAIKSGVRRDQQAKPLIMMTAEQFTSSFIDGLKQGMPLFRNKFRGISALLVDDVQFFAGKESTQTEFLRTIDLLKGQGIQIVLTGDRPLNGLADLLKPEIIARLEAGMSCEIKPADREMLLAIFKQMAAARNLKLSDDVCEYVTSHLTTHARQLSGAINRLHAAVLTSNRPVTLDSVENLLEDMIRNNRRAVRLQDIDKAVCETLQLGGQSLQSKSRAKQATHPRMLAMWLARKYTRSALSEIGKYFGNRSHSTVVSAQKKVDSWLQESPDFGLTDSPLTVAEAIQKIERLLQTH